MSVDWKTLQGFVDRCPDISNGADWAKMKDEAAVMDDATGALATEHLYLFADRADPEDVMGFNPNHEPGGSSSGGRFAPSDGPSGPSNSHGPPLGSGQALADLPDEVHAKIGSIDSKYGASNRSAKETISRFQDSSGKLSPERAALHDQIVAKVLAGSAPSANPEFVLMGGGMAAGKSTILSSGNVDLPAGHVLVDGDAIKAAIPEYQAMLGKDSRAAAYVHEESSVLAKRSMAEAFSDKNSVVMDGTGNSTLNAIKSKSDQARAAGLTVRGEYVTVDTETAVARNIDRGRRTGRLIPETELRRVHASVSRLLPEAVKQGMFDKLNLWDTNLDKPTLVMSAVGSTMTVHDPDLWQRFLKKGEA